MVDISFLHAYKGVLYPLPEETSSDLGTNPGDVKSLVDLCAEKIVLDGTTTTRAIDTVPSELCYSLMRAALGRQRDRAIEVLISRWSWPLLRLQKLAPVLFDSLNVVYERLYVADRMRKAVKYTTCLAHTFVECLKKRAPTKLKYLDLTGYPAAEVIVNYLSSHVLLVYNETRQREIISMYNEVTRNLPKDQRQSYNIDTTLPDETFVISLDAYVQTNETHMELCRALKTSHLEQCRFQLRLHRLDLSCVGVARVSVLLEQVNPQYLVGLSLQYNALSNDGLPILVPNIKRLVNLTSLDLSCNNFMLTNQEEAVAQLGDMFAALPKLTRLDLSNNRVKHKLGRLLSNIQSPLQFLRLCGCGLSQTDLIYLKCSHHTNALKELDISENSLGKNYLHLVPLIMALPLLHTLEIQDCDFLGPDFLHMFTILPHLVNLRYLNMCLNTELHEEIFLSNIPFLCDIPRLEVVKISVVPDLIDSDEEENFDEMAAIRRFDVRVAYMCKKKNRSPIKVVVAE